MKTITKTHCQGIVQVTLPLTTFPTAEAKTSLQKELIDKALELVPNRRGQIFVSPDPDLISVLVIPSLEESKEQERFIMP